MGLSSLLGLSGNKSKTYDAVYSLGPNCACADYLRRMGLRAAAGPFDWLLADKPARGLEVLLGGFNGFMNPGDFVESSDGNQTFRRFYRNTKTGYLFLHDFSWDGSFADQFQSVCAKYERRWRRLWTDVNSAKKVLLVLYAEMGGTLSAEELKKWSDLLVSAFGPKVDLWCIQYDEHQAEDLRSIKISGQVNLYVLGNTAAYRREAGNLQWDKARVKPIFSKIRVRLTWRERLARLYPATVRLRALFIWNKAKRHDFVESRLGK